MNSGLLYRMRRVAEIFPRSRVGILSKIGLILAVFVASAYFNIYLFYSYAGVSSSNAALYFIRDADNKLRISGDLPFDESDDLVFMIDVSPVFRFFEGVASSAYDHPVLKLSWEEETGHGIIKETRPDGTKFLIILSRFEEAGAPRGVFIGGDLEYGDADRLNDTSRNNTGMAFYNGQRWVHVWCSINESVSIRGLDRPISPWEWEYLGSDVLKSSPEEVLILSRHALNTVTRDSLPVKLLMTRTLHKKSGDDYVTMKVEYSNIGPAPVDFAYAYGDEPWIGDFGTSSGDIGWTEGTVFKHESYLLPAYHRFAGLWDFGNDLAGEDHTFSGYANFVEWIFNPPSLVYFSNSFEQGEVNETRLLDSGDNRIINLLWMNESMQPGQQQAYTFALGMAKPDPFTGLPKKPAVDHMNN